MVWFPFVKLALSSPVQVLVLRPCGRKLGFGSVKARVESSKTKLPNFWDVRKNAGARLNPSRASFVIVPVGLHLQASERNFSESLLFTSGTVSYEVSISGRSTI